MASELDILKSMLLKYETHLQSIGSDAKWMNDDIANMITETLRVQSVIDDLGAVDPAPDTGPNQVLDLMQKTYDLQVKMNARAVTIKSNHESAILGALVLADRATSDLGITVGMSAVDAMFSKYFLAAPAETAEAPES